MAVTVEQYRNLKFGTRIHWDGWRYGDGDPKKISICSGYIPSEGSVSLLIHKSDTTTSIGWTWPPHVVLWLQQQGHVVTEYRGWWVSQENITLIDPPIQTSSMNCVECKEAYNYAEPNFDGDKLVCYPCRDRLGWKYTPKVNGFISLR
jgi:hypothetical protein